VGANWGGTGVGEVCGVGVGGEAGVNGVSEEGGGGNVVRVCEWCGASMGLTRSRNRNVAYCSVSCYGRARRGRVKEADRKRKLPEDPEEVRDLYWGEWRSLREIASKYRVHETTVGQYMARHGIERRKRGGSYVRGKVA